MTLWTTISARPGPEKQEELLFIGIIVPAGPDTHFLGIPCDTRIIFLEHFLLVLFFFFFYFIGFLP